MGKTRTAPGSQKENEGARSAEDLKPLLELCRAGKLFEVQEWIAAGKPVRLASDAPLRRAVKSPLEVAIDRGFHSLVQVLLRGGAAATPQDWAGPMGLALSLRRWDIIQLLVQGGYDPKAVSMRQVFHTWDPEIMEYFIDRGADSETGNPLAYALCQRIRTALRVFKRYQDRFPSFPEQANIALRHHCKEGNLKWVSLLLWARADPYATGPSHADEECGPDNSGVSALGYAALYGHFEIFDLKAVRLQPQHPSMREVVRWGCRGKGLGLLKRLLDLGMPVNDQDNGGSSILQNLVNRMGWTFRYDPWDMGRDGLDSDETRDQMKAILHLAEHGARWMPRDEEEIKAVRRSLLKLKPVYTAEFIGILSHHGACAKASVDSMLRTKSIQAHVAPYEARIQKALASLP